MTLPPMGFATIRAAVAAVLAVCVAGPVLAADPPADLPTEQQVRAVLPVWCQYKNQERSKLQREADGLFGINPVVTGREPTLDDFAAHQKIVDQWKEPRLAALNAAFKTRTGLDYYAVTHVATPLKLGLQCPR